MRAALYVGKGLIDRDAFDQGREIVQDLDRGISQPLIVLEMAADKDEPGAQFARLAARHAAMNAKGLGLVGGGQHHAAADGNRLAAQARIQELLDRGIEGIEIRMEDGGAGIHWNKMRT